jgi:hypothetical protein
MPGTFRAKATFHEMTDQGHFDTRPTPRRGLSVVFLLLGGIIGAGAMAIVGSHSLPPPSPPPAPQATIPSETTQAIQDLQAGQQKAADQLQAIQQTLASDQANAKELSGQVSALSDKMTSQVNAISDKLEALRQSFGSQPPPSEAPARRRGSR